MGAPRTYTHWDLVFAVAESGSVRQVLSRLGLKEAGGNYQTVKERIKTTGLNIDHFHGQAWSKGKKITTRSPRPLTEILVEGRRCQTNKLKKRLIREGIKEARCEQCGLERWQDRPAPLELDHVNGRLDDNRIENLRIICPNCHAQTPTYRGRNVGREANN